MAEQHRWLMGELEEQLIQERERNKMLQIRNEKLEKELRCWETLAGPASRVAMDELKEALSGEREHIKVLKTRIEELEAERAEKRKIRSEELATRIEEDRRRQASLSAIMQQLCSDEESQA